MASTANLRTCDAEMILVVHVCTRVEQRTRTRNATRERLVFTDGFVFGGGERLVFTDGFVFTVGSVLETKRDKTIKQNSVFGAFGERFPKPAERRRSPMSVLGTHAEHQTVHPRVLGTQPKHRTLHRSVFG
jgi:hypothetical protein